MFDTTQKAGRKIVMIDLSERENIEWTNSWREKANEENVNRVAVLGDSVARQIRGTMQKLLGNDPVVDFFGTSLQVTDPQMMKELDHFFIVSEYAYQKIIINLGGHHGYDPKRWTIEQDYGRYKQAFEQLIAHLQTYCRQIIVVGATHHCFDNCPSKVDEETNQYIMARNKAMQEIAAKNAYPFVDLYEFMKTGPGKEIRHSDYVHFLHIGDELMASYILAKAGLIDEKVYLEIRDRKVRMSKQDLIDNLKSIMRR